MVSVSEEKVKIGKLRPMRVVQHDFTQEHSVGIIFTEEQFEFGLID